MAWSIHNPFPGHALGQILAPAVWQHHGNSQLPVELIAPIALGLAAAAVHDLYDVERPNLQPSPISLFIAIIAGSGEGKDAAASPFVKPFFDFQARADEDYATKLKAYDVDLQEWAVEERLLVKDLEEALRATKNGGAPKQSLPVQVPTSPERTRGDGTRAADIIDVEIKGLRDDGGAATTGGDVAAIKQRLLSHAERRPKPPRSPQVIYDDATVTAIKTSLCDRWRSGILFSMEASAMFNGRLGAEYAFWNAAWGGQPVFLDRVTEGRRAVHDPRVGMVAGIQEVPFRRFIRNRGEEAHDSGFTARYLIAIPPSTKGFRTIGSWQMTTDALDAYAARVRELLEAGAAATLAGRKRSVLRLSSKAAEKFVGYYNLLQQLMAPGQPYSTISGQAAKAAENVARVAAVLHVIDGLEGEISEDTLMRAGAIVEWFVNQFLTMFAIHDARPPLEQDAAAVELALWRAHASGVQSVPRQELKYWCPPGVHGARLDRSLQFLLENRRAIILRHEGKLYVALMRGVPLPPVSEGHVPRGRS